jgi:hypothetical protein
MYHRLSWHDIDPRNCVPSWCLLEVGAPLILSEKLEASRDPFLEKARGVILLTDAL